MALFKSAYKELQVICNNGSKIKFADGVYTTADKEEITALKHHPMVWEVSTVNEIKKSKNNDIKV